MMKLDLNRREFLSATVAASAAKLIRAPATVSTKPNIVFFMVDQLAAKWLWDNNAMNLPNFTNLRSRGTAFVDCCASNPICCPSRATLATGMRTRSHGLLQNGFELDPTIPTIARQLQSNGWRTGAFGKVHHKPAWSGVHPDYRPYGYDIVFNTEDPRGGFWLDWVATEHPEWYTQALATVHEDKVPEFSVYGPKKINLRPQILKVRESFNFATPQFPDNTFGRYTFPFPNEISQTEWITRHAVDFIGNSDRSQPIHAHISYVAPHPPHEAPADFFHNVDEARIPTPVPVEWLNDPLHPRCFPFTPGGGRIPKDWRRTRQFYMAAVTHLDYQLGVVTQALQTSGRLDNTYLIVLSDHGDLLGDHGFNDKNERHYDSCVRVPLMIAGPGLRHGATCHDLVQLEDIFPTVMEMAGLPLPTPRFARVLPDFPDGPPQGAEPYAGSSLLGICRGETPKSWRDAVEIESYNNVNSLTPDFWARSVRTKEWRYTLYPGNTGEQMFALKDDPDEQHNLAGDAGYRRIRAEMRDRLLEMVILQDYPHTPRDCYRLGVY